jgi:hypothetical protein
VFLPILVIQNYVYLLVLISLDQEMSIPYSYLITGYTVLPTATVISCPDLRSDAGAKGVTD